ncbi:hypothetical protein GN244_ATG13825 [Phytophthora infestans]|uniref:Uncharacterized protein n=1 Tax=Phytophthora infestans TaxID=4787 RepID=A0A833SNP3_PHYIN|nr:hypothetical protein GN244_ATG13825 [Phytophthora infestans]
MITKLKKQQKKALSSKGSSHFTSSADPAITIEGMPIFLRYQPEDDLDLFRSLARSIGRIFGKWEYLHVRFLEKYPNSKLGANALRCHLKEHSQRRTACVEKQVQQPPSVAQKRIRATSCSSCGKRYLDDLYRYVSPIGTVNGMEGVDYVLGERSLLELYMITISGHSDTDGYDLTGWCDSSGEAVGDRNKMRLDVLSLSESLESDKMWQHPTGLVSGYAKSARDARQ